MRTRFAVLCALVTTMFAAVPFAGSAEIRWSAGGTAEYFSEVSEYIGISPGLEASASLQIAEFTALGVLFDRAAYRPVLGTQSGSQWRVLFLVERHWETSLLGRRMQPFFQFGLGMGQIQYSDPIRGIQILPGPTGRFAIGSRLSVTDHLDWFVLVAFDRMDSAINALIRKYPTTLGLTLGATIRLPRGERPHADVSAGTFHPGKR